MRREGHCCKDYACSDRNLYSMRSFIWSGITEFRSSNNRSGYHSLTAMETYGVIRVRNKSLLNDSVSKLKSVDVYRHLK